MSGLEIARVEGLRASAVFYWMGCLLGGPREDDLEPAEWAAHREELAAIWSTWRAVVAGLVATVVVEDDARERLETRYPGRTPCLLPDAEVAWSRFADLVDRLWSLALDLVPTSAEAEATDRGGDLLETRVSERAQTLADDARISALDRLGDSTRALRILERRLAFTGAEIQARAVR